MEQLNFSLEEPLANHSQSQVSVKVSKTQEVILPSSIVDFLTTLDPSGSFGRTCQVSSVVAEDGILVPSSGRWQNSGMGSHTEFLTLNTSEFPKDDVESSLSDVLEVGNLPQKFYLTPIACQGIIRRAEKRNKELPPLLKGALHMVAQIPLAPTQSQESGTKAQEAQAEMSVDSL